MFAFVSRNIKHTQQIPAEKGQRAIESLQFKQNHHNARGVILHILQTQMLAKNSFAKHTSCQPPCGNLFLK